MGCCTKNHFLLNIQSLYPSLTTAEKKIADYVLENYKSVRFMAINDLAEACHVSLTSVFRFCKSLDLKGYQDFRVQLTTSISEEESAQQQEQALLPAEVSREDSIQILGQKVVQSYITTLQESLTLLDPDAVKAAAALINDSDQVRFFGTGGSHLTAMEGMYKFLHIMPNVYCLADSTMQMMATSTLNERDVAIFISYSGANKEIVTMAQQAHEVGARTIGITQHKNPPLTQYMDVILLCGGYEPPLQEGAFPSKTGHMLMLDILFTEVYRTKFDYSKDINSLVTHSVVSQNF